MADWRAGSVAVVGLQARISRALTVTVSYSGLRQGLGLLLAIYDRLRVSRDWVNSLGLRVRFDLLSPLTD